MIYPSDPAAGQVAPTKSAPLPNQKPVVEFGFPAVGIGLIAVLVVTIVLVLVFIGVGWAAAAPAGVLSSSQTKFVQDFRNLDLTAVATSIGQIIERGFDQAISSLRLT